MSADSIEDKLPQITLAFWVMKICATTLGETAGDQLSMTMHVGYGASSLILLAGFGIALTAQLVSSAHRVWLYWTVILLTSTAGTTLSDFMDRTLGLGYATGSAILVALLCTVLATWWASTGNLSVSHVRTRRAEVFYWTAILVSNTLGTAVGDYLADDSGLGFAGGAALIAGLIALLAATNALTHVSKVLLFWGAFVLTRPLGATVGDLLTKPTDAGGLDLGTLAASGVLFAVLVALVIAQTVRSERRTIPAGG